MQRPIEFRVWDKSREHFGSLREWNLLPSFEGAGVPSNLVLQQFTGMLDSKGRKIFEGDIVAEFKDWWGNIHKNGVVHYNPKEAKFCFKRKKNTGGMDYVKPEKGWEVIGNIFENSKLLK